MYTEKLNREERADHVGGSRGGFSRKERKGRGGEWKSQLTVEVEQRRDKSSVMVLFVLDMRLMPFGHGAFSFGHGAFPF